MEFREVISSVYRQDPCGILPNALWKTLVKLDNYEVEFSLNDETEVEKIQIWNSEEFLLYYHRDNEFNPKLNPINFTFDLVILHDDYKPVINEIEQSYGEVKLTEYFRLIHTLEEITPMHARDYLIIDLDPKKDKDDMISVLRAAYPEWTFDKERILTWKKSPVFTSDLWVGIANEDEELLGFGIAEYDDTVGEVSLEWIQVDPDYQGKGVGSLVINELLSRSQDMAEFATVAGRSETSLENFYRKSGFTGSDAWWVLLNQ